MLMRSAVTLNGHKRKSGESELDRCIFVPLLQIQAQLFYSKEFKMHHLQICDLETNQLSQLA